MPTSSFEYVIEHMEDQIKGWPELEYTNILLKTNNLHLILQQNFDKASIPDALAGAKITFESIATWPQAEKDRVLLLDPASTQLLSPADGLSYKYLLFGGILGDDPPKDRTKQLRDLGFVTRQLGNLQMTTDTAVMVAQQIVEHRINIEDLEWVDFPDIQLSRRESVQMPFRYLKTEGGGPLLPKGMVAHLKKTNNEPVNI